MPPLADELLGSASPWLGSSDPDFAPSGTSATCAPLIPVDGHEVAASFHRPSAPRTRVATAKMAAPTLPRPGRAPVFVTVGAAYFTVPELAVVSTSRSWHEL